MWFMVVSDTCGLWLSVSLTLVVVVVDFVDFGKNKCVIMLWGRKANAVAR